MLTTRAPFHLRLESFQGVNPVNLDLRVEDRQRFLDGRAHRQFHLRPPPRHRQARAGHEGEVELAGGVHHVAGQLAVVGQVLVAKHRHRPAGLAEDLHDLLEHFVPRVELLAALVVRVVPVFSDQQHAIDGQLVAAERQRLGDGLVQVKLELLGQFLTEVVLADLGDVHAGDGPVGVVHATAAQVAVQEAAANMVGVRQVVVGRGDDGEAALGLIGARRRQAARPLAGLLLVPGPRDVGAGGEDGGAGGGLQETSATQVVGGG